MFYLTATVLGLAAVGFVIWPVLARRKQAAYLSHDQVARSVYRARLEELASETEDIALRKEIESELGLVLLTEIGSPETGNDHRRDRSAGIPAEGMPAGPGSAHAVGLLAAGVTGCALLLYLTLADPGLRHVRGAEEVISLGVADKVALQSWVLKLEERTTAAPRDNKSWYLLGHAYLKLNLYANASEAFGMADKLTPHDLSVQVYWLQSRYLAGGSRLDQFSRNLADRILSQQPNIPVVIEILALDAFHQGRNAEAVTLLNRGMTASTDLRRQASFATAIQRVRRQMQDVPPGITVKVAAEGPAPPHAAVFVLARPVGGGMPYAVVRRPAFMLPFSIRLDDLVSMSPEHKISAAQAFEVVARLSSSGNAVAQPGDWEWRSEAVPGIASQPPALEVILAPLAAGGDAD